MTSRGAAAMANGEPSAAAAYASKRAMYFGRGVTSSRPLFGWYHAPPHHDGSRGPRRGIGVVLCPPLGYEGICAYPAQRIFAERLAARGFPTLRFDYDGTGDSAGSDEDPDRVRAWIASIVDAIDELRAQSGVDEVCVFGVRMGATLGLLAAAERGDVERLVLWNPCPTGRAFLREMKAFRMLAEQSGEAVEAPRASADTGEESGGFLFARETVEAIRGIDLLKVPHRAAGRVLVIGRDDVPNDDKLARALESRGAVVTHQNLPGYAAMMVAPHKSAFPAEVAGALFAWLEDDAPALLPPAGRRASEPSARGWGMVAPNVREEPVTFGHGDALFGVLTLPVGESAKPGRPLVVFTNTAGNHRVGPNRMFVPQARRLAELGFPSLRFDVSGNGDSIVRRDPADNHPYSDRVVQDAVDAIRHLAAARHARSFVVAGLCSGAFVAWHAALLEPRVVGIALINLQIFEWEEGMSLEVNPLKTRGQAEYYKNRLFTKDAWKNLLAGEVDVRRSLRVLGKRVVDAARARVATLKTKIRIDPKHGPRIARAFNALTSRGTDVFMIFSGGDPGIDNLREKVGPSLQPLLERPNFAIATIDGPDHSFTPVWSQEELGRVLVTHVADVFARD